MNVIETNTKCMVDVGKRMRGIKNVKERNNLIYDFKSISEFVEYLENTETNKVFSGREMLSQLASKKESKNNTKWTQTSSYEEALNLLRTGWSTGALSLTQSLKHTKKNDYDFEKRYRNFLSTSGFQAVVPLYLQGMPMNMINRKQVAIKQKVLTIVKAVSVSSKVSSEELLEQNVDCLRVVDKLEKSGYRVNLFVVMSTTNLFVRIKLKSANERMNVSKLAFVLCHPSMFRRLFLRFIEVCPDTKSDLVKAYGFSNSEEEVKRTLGEESLLMPTLIRKMKDKTIGNLSVDDLIARLK